LVLGENLDADKLTADYDAGVLTVRSPVAEQAKPRRIDIATSGSHKAISG
jgi:HSP20 family protein